MPLYNPAKYESKKGKFSSAIESFLVAKFPNTDFYNLRNKLNKFEKKRL